MNLRVKEFSLKIINQESSLIHYQNLVAKYLRMILNRKPLAMALARPPNFFEFLCGMFTL